MATMLSAVAMLLAGCATNESQVRAKSANDLGCDASAVSVALTERPYVGVTRYVAEGCGSSRTYECRAPVYSMGIPLGQRHCSRPSRIPVTSDAPDRARL